MRKKKRPMMPYPERDPKRRWCGHESFLSRMQIVAPSTETKGNKKERTKKKEVRYACNVK
jgi:hypothetical protein